MEPNPFVGAKSFSQKLNLHTGDITIETTSADNNVKVNLWVDVFNPVVHVKTNYEKPVNITAIYETWRSIEKRIFK